MGLYGGINDALLVRQQFKADQQAEQAKRRADEAAAIATRRDNMLSDFDSKIQSLAAKGKEMAQDKNNPVDPLTDQAYVGLVQEQVAADLQLIGEWNETHPENPISVSQYKRNVQVAMMQRVAEPPKTPAQIAADSVEGKKAEMAAMVENGTPPEEAARLVGLREKDGKLVDVTVDVDVEPENPLTGDKPLSRKIFSEKLVRSMDAKSRYTRIRNTMQPKFLKMGTKLNAAWTAAKEKYGDVPFIGDLVGKVSPEDQQMLEEYTTFKSTALQNLNTTLNELSGAAVSAAEFDRITRALPDPGVGIFQGDSPTQFVAKLKRVETDINMAIARANYILNGLATGMTYDDIVSGNAMSLGFMKNIVDDQIEKWRQEGVSVDVIKQRTLETFGFMP